MNYFLKYRFAIWGIIILSVIILSSVGTLLFLKLSHSNDKPRDPETRRHMQIGQFFRNELKLSPEQENAFKGYRKLFFQNTKIIFDSIEKKRVGIIQELSKPKPDSLILFHLSDEIGVLHAKLKIESIRNLLRLRAICTPEQVKKLNTINNELIMPEGPMHRMNKRKGPPQNERRQ
jgi:hypothetical protein